MFREHIQQRLTIGSLPIHKYHCLARVVFRAHIQRWEVVSWETIHLFLLLERVPLFSTESVKVEHTNTRILSVGESRVSSPYSAHIGGMPSTKTQISDVDASTYSSELACNLSSNKQISSVWASHVWSPYLAQIELCRAPKHEFLRLARGKFRAGIQYRKAVCRASIHTFLNLGRVMCREHI